MSNYFVKITDVQKMNFCFYGNECIYAVEVYNSKKKKIGEADGINVVQRGTDYDSVFEELYYLCEEGDRENIADCLGVDEVSDDWFDEDGMIDVEKLPKSVLDYIYDSYDQMLIDCYISEDFADEDENGLIALDVFANQLIFGHIGYFREMNTDLPLAKMFENVGGWYTAETCCQEGESSSPDLTSKEGKDLFVKLATIVAKHLENYDYVSAMVNIRYYGDYDKETCAQEDMNYTYAEMAYIILTSLLPQINECSARGWKSALHNTIISIGRKIGLLYREEEPELEDLYDEIYKGLKDGLWLEELYNHSTFEYLISALIKHGIYPMSDKRYAELKNDRDIFFLDDCIE